MPDFETELRKTFLEEARELLEAAEAGFIALDAGDHSDDLINKLFRVAHSFKGSAAAVGFSQLSRFAHHVEDVLAKVKTRELVPGQSVCSTFFSALDILRAYTEGLERHPQLVIDSLEVEQALMGHIDANKIAVMASPMTTESQGFGFFDDDIAPPIPPESLGTQILSVTPIHAKSSAESDSIRIATAKLDTLLNAVGELVVNQTMLQNHRVNRTLGCDDAVATIQYMNSIVNEVKEVSLSLRMLPAKPLFQKMQRAVRDTALTLTKAIDFVCIGEHVEIDKILLDSMTDPLTHLVRNAVDHGIESAEQRVLIKKPPTARVELTLVHADDKVLITITDDGKGLDKDVLIKKARDRGLINRDTPLSDQDAYKLIFLPGFSTKDQVTEISGRGVGLDVVQKAVEKLQGSIAVESKLGVGAKFIIALPLSFSIIQGMVILVDDRKYVVPIPQLVETIKFQGQKIETSIGTGRMMNLRGEVIPIYSLGEILHGSHRRPLSPNDPLPPGLVTFTHGIKVSYEIDAILGSQQIVLKKLGKEMQGLPGITAGAILANGEPSLVLSLSELAHKRRSHVA